MHHEKVQDVGRGGAGWGGSGQGGEDQGGVGRGELDGRPLMGAGRFFFGCTAKSGITMVVFKAGLQLN